jgi:signal transduction histidine kinase
MRAQDDERRRIAQMLHETTAHNLAGLKMILARLNRTSDRLNDDERNALVESMSLAEQSMTEIRTLSYLLHPPFLDAGSKTAHIRLQRDAKTLVLEIDDRGHGIPNASLEHIMSGGGVVGVGIAGMSERMKQLGGSLEITSSDQGTTVRARLRLVEDAD